MGKLRDEYGEKLNSLEVPPHLKELLVRVITLLLRKIQVPQDEIDKLVEEIDERGISEMLAIENYNVQETRRQAREDERRKRLEAERKAGRKVKKAERKKQEAERKMQEAERQAGALAQLLLKQGSSLKSIAESLAISEQNVLYLISLSSQACDVSGR